MLSSLAVSLGVVGIVPGRSSNLLITPPRPHIAGRNGPMAARFFPPGGDSADIRLANPHRTNDQLTTIIKARSQRMN